MLFFAVVSSVLAADAAGGSVSSVGLGNGGEVTGACHQVEVACGINFDPADLTADLEMMRTCCERTVSAQKCSMLVARLKTDFSGSKEDACQEAIDLFEAEQAAGSVLLTQGTRSQGVVRKAGRVGSVVRHQRRGSVAVSGDGHIGISVENVAHQHGESEQKREETEEHHGEAEDAQKASEISGLENAPADSGPDAFVEKHLQDHGARSQEARRLESLEVLGLGPNENTTSWVNGIPIYNVDQAGTISSLIQDDSKGNPVWEIVFPESYSDADEARFCQDAQRLGATCETQGHPSAGGLAFVSLSASKGVLDNVLRGHPEVQFAEADMPMSAIDAVHSDSQLAKANASDADLDKSLSAKGGRRRRRRVWGLDRVNDITGFDSDEGGRYKIDDWGGNGITVYVFDTGVNYDHQDFQGRAQPGVDCVSSSTCRICGSDRNCARDRQGHGTHCAGTVGGFRYGSAKKAQIRSVKTLGDDGRGSYGAVIRGLDWVMTQRRRSVASMSLGGPGRVQGLTEAFRRARNQGVAIVVAAGNNNQDACNFSPAFVPEAITVGSIDEGNDHRSSFSNWGRCIDVFAPGRDVRSAGHQSSNQERTLSGTSMATPLVAGAVAQMFSVGLDTPQAVEQQLFQVAGQNMVRDPWGSPNRLLRLSKCSTEHGTCRCRGWAKFGRDNRWTGWRYVSGSIHCASGAFGSDPYRGTVKECLCHRR